VLVDLLLPDLSGEELIRRLRREKPGLAIIATTGVLRTTSAQRPLLQAGANRVLAKPFASDALTGAVRAILP
jgi:DNA-binding response OmpR family regulator